MSINRYHIFISIALLSLVKIGIVLFAVDFLSEKFPMLYWVNRFPDGYDRIAENIIGGHGYRFFSDTSHTLVRAPGYVIFLVLMFLVFGKNLLAVQIANIAFTAGTAIVLFHFSRRFVASNGKLLLLLTAFMLHPAVVLSESRGGVESLFTLFFTIFMFFLYRSLENATYRDFLWCGLFLGISCLVKSTPIVMPVFILFYVLLVEKSKPYHVKKLTGCALLILALFACLSPWMVRNYLVAGKFIPTTTIVGTTAFQGLYYNKHFPTSKPHYKVLIEATEKLAEIAKNKNLPARRKFFNIFYKTQDEIYFNDYLIGRIKSEYLGSPLLMAKSALLNLTGFWIQGRTHKTTVMNMMVTIPLLVLSVVGVIRGIKNKLYLGPLFLVICVFVVVHLPILGVARYQVPLLPFMLLLAVIAIAKNDDFSQTHYVKPGGNHADPNPTYT